MSDALFTLENKLRGDKGSVKLRRQAVCRLRDQDSGAHNMLTQINVRNRIGIGMFALLRRKVLKLGHIARC